MHPDRGIQTRCGRLRFCLAALLLLLIQAGTLSAAGLTLYSYRDDQGQIIVVDSLEKIPAQFRHQAEKNFIPSFRRPAPKKELTIIEALPDVAGPATGKPPTGPGTGDISILPPPAEDFSAEKASATAFLAQFRSIQFNNERIHVVARTMVPNNPVILALHQENVQTMQKLESLHQFTWEKAERFKTSALKLFERYKTILYTISRWLQEGGRGLDQGLLPLLSESERLLLQLEQELNLAIDD